MEGTVEELKLRRKEDGKNRRGPTDAKGNDHTEMDCWEHEKRKLDICFQSAGVRKREKE